MIQKHQFSNESINYLTPSWQQMNQLAFALAQKIDSNSDNFDHIVMLTKGLCKIN